MIMEDLSIFYVRNKENKLVKFKIIAINLSPCYFKIKNLEKNKVVFDANGNPFRLILKKLKQYIREEKENNHLRYLLTI